jgi:hypothetical protein
MGKKPKGFSQADLAAALGISGAAVTRYKQRGMPTHSADAARAWRRQYVRPRMNWRDPRTSLYAQFELVRRLGALVVAELRHGSNCGAMVEDLRAALSGVPDDARGLVALPVEVWDALMPTAALQAFSERGCDEAVPVNDGTPEAAVLFALCCGEARLL